MLAVTVGRLEDVKSALFGKKWERFEVEGHPVSVSADVERDVLRRVTITLASYRPNCACSRSGTRAP